MSKIFYQIFAERSDIKFTALGGPTFAAEVGKKFPTVTVLAAEDHVVGTYVQRILSNK